MGDLNWCGPDGIKNLAVTDTDKAAVLQEYFSSVYTVEPDGSFNNLIDRTLDGHRVMYELKITEEDVYSKLCNLKIDKSPGLDMIHPRVLYEMRDIIKYPLFLIYNKSLQSGVLPSEWKLAEVTAVHKKGSKSDRGNYRPISLTSVCCKIMEIFIRNHIMSYLLQNKLVSNKQRAIDNVTVVVYVG